MATSFDPRSSYVLVVDDDPDVRETVRTILEAYGYVVVTATDGLEGLRVVRSSPPPALILLDLMMPRMSGLEFRAELVRDPILAAIPIVVFSGDPHTIGKANSIGAPGLPKPIELEVLMATIQRFCPLPSAGSGG